MAHQDLAKLYDLQQNLDVYARLTILMAVYGCIVEVCPQMPDYLSAVNPGNKDKKLLNMNFFLCLLPAIVLGADPPSPMVVVNNQRTSGPTRLLDLAILSVKVPTDDTQVGKLMTRWNDPL